MLCATDVFSSLALSAFSYIAFWMDSNKTASCVAISSSATVIFSPLSLRTITHCPFSMSFGPSSILDWHALHFVLMNFLRANTLRIIDYIRKRLSTNHIIRALWRALLPCACNRAITAWSARFSEDFSPCRLRVHDNPPTNGWHSPWCEKKAYCSVKSLPRKLISNAFAKWYPRLCWCRSATPVRHASALRWCVWHCAPRFFFSLFWPTTIRIANILREPFGRFQSSALFLFVLLECFMHGMTFCQRNSLVLERSSVFSIETTLHTGFI